MNDTNRTLDDEEIMLAFSVEPDHGPATLQRYLRDYPHLAHDFLDLVADLRLASEPEAISAGDLESPAILSAWESFVGEVSPENTSISPELVAQVEASLVSLPMRKIGLPVSVLVALKSGLVKVEGFPARWSAKIAAAGGYTIETLQAFVARPPTLSPSASFKSQGAPAIGEKVSFRELIESSTLTEAEKAEILREE